MKPYSHVINCTHISTHKQWRELVVPDGWLQADSGGWSDVWRQLPGVSQEETQGLWTHVEFGPFAYHPIEPPDPRRGWHVLNQTQGQAMASKENKFFCIYFICFLISKISLIIAGTCQVKYIKDWGSSNCGTRVIEVAFPALCGSGSP